MIEEKLVLRNSKGQKIAGLLFKPDLKEFPIVIFCHGYRSDKNNSKVAALKNVLPWTGVGLFAFDFSGRGESDGKFEDTTISQYIDDLRCCIDFVSKLTKKIVVIGSSLGGLVSLQEVSGDKRVKVLVLFSPVSHFPWRNTKEFSDVKGWKSKGFAFTESKRCGKLRINYSFYEDGIKYGDYDIYKKIKIPTLIVHGNLDESVPFEDSEELKKYVKNSELLVLKDADHTYSGKADFDKVISETARFVVECLK